MNKKSAIVVGAGIIGLACARALVKRDYQVTVIERNHRAIGASIRNFGMIWPIGQPDGNMYEQASLSRAIWVETISAANLWHDDAGSMHLAFEKDEWDVLQELGSIYKNRNYRLLNADKARLKSPFVNSEGLIGGLFSEQEMVVNPRQVIQQLPVWLKESAGVDFFWGTAATEIQTSRVIAGGKTFEADEIYICSGEDFETLYPKVFAAQALTKCKLQMMKMQRPAGGNRIGPSICGGLSLLHYNSFKAAGSLEVLRARMSSQYHELLKFGIHVMVSQNDAGELIIGDSHEYHNSPDPFNNAAINEMILTYLNGFAIFPDSKIIETWSGVYPKLTNGHTNIVLSPEPGVTIINGLGGAGMTLGFGLCEQVVGGK